MKKISTRHFHYITFSVVIILSCCFFSCDPENFSSVCVSKVLKEKGFHPYTGSHIKDDTFYLRHFTWNGDDYFQESNPFIDLLILPYNCEFISLSEEEYSVYREEAELIGVVGIKL